jgi:hypothetical protein
MVQSWPKPNIRKRIKAQISRKEERDKAWGKEQADGLYAKQEEGWKEQEE